MPAIALGRDNPPHGLPTSLRGMLHCTIDLDADPGHADRQAGRHTLRPTDAGRRLRAFRRSAPPQRVHFTGPVQRDVRAHARASDALAVSTRAQHDAGHAATMK
jgi:hypothetical protein